MSSWIVITLGVALLGVVAYLMGAMWLAERRATKLRGSGSWGGFVQVHGADLVPATTQTANSAVTRLPKGSRMGFLHVTPEDVSFRPLPFSRLWGARRFRMTPDLLRRVHYAVNDPRSMFVELHGCDGHILFHCPRPQGLPEAMEHLVPNSSPGNAG